MKEGESDANSNEAAINDRENHSNYEHLHVKQEKTHSNAISSSHHTTTTSTNNLLSSLSSLSGSNGSNNKQIVSSSTNGTSVITSPGSRSDSSGHSTRGSRSHHHHHSKSNSTGSIQIDQLAAAQARAVRAHFVGSALVAIGTDLAAAAAATGIQFPPVVTADQRTLLAESVLAELSAVAARSQAHLPTESNNNNKSSKNNSSSNSSEGSSNSASPLSLGLMSVTKRETAKPRAADSPGSGSTTSTTTGPGGCGGRDKVFVCTVCNRSFGYKHVLQNHERTHTGEKPFECRECHKRFTRDHHLKTHMRLHTGEKPYHCTHCDRQFVQVANLRRHLRVHTGERPYACELCTSKFSDSNQLKAHMLIHRGEKPFSCSKCLGKFRRRHHLMHHKCPKDEANLGKPRRGRRPKAYDHQISSLSTQLSSSTMKSRTSGDELSQTGNGGGNGNGNGNGNHGNHAVSTVTSSTAAYAAAATSSLLPFYHHHQLSPVAKPLIPDQHPPAAHGGVAHVGSTSIGRNLESSSKRRKPKQTIRIITPEHRELFLHHHQHHDSIQTQPLNLSISPGGIHSSVSHHKSHQASVIVPRSSYLRSDNNSPDEILDLSRSRSDIDSEAEPIEEEVDEGCEEYDTLDYVDDVDPDDDVDVDPDDDVELNSTVKSESHHSSDNGNGNGRIMEVDDVEDDGEEDDGDATDTDDNEKGAIALTTKL